MVLRGEAEIVPIRSLEAIFAFEAEDEESEEVLKFDVDQILMVPSG